MLLALEALGVDLVNVLGTRGARREPTVCCHHFETANGGVVARSLGHLGLDGLAAQRGCSHCSGRQGFQTLLLRGSRGSIDANVIRSAELRLQMRIVLRR